MDREPRVEMHPLQELIYKKGYTLTEFADICGISRQSFYSLFSGRTKSMRTEYQHRISENLHEPFEKIIYLTTEGL